MIRRLRRALSAGAFFLWFMCGSVFHILKILKLDQVQIYDKSQKKKKMFSKRTGQTPPPPVTSARSDGIKLRKKVPVYFWKKQILAF